MNDKNKTALDDISAIKGYIMGVVAFAGAVGGFCTTVFHFRPEPTWMAVTGVAVASICIGFLVQRSEQRQATALKEHVVASDKLVSELREDMLENKRSNLRNEMNLMMALKPQNHKTILRMAQRYFVELKGDWVETDEFGDWVEKEKEAGRKVHIPVGLASVIADLQAKEDGEGE